MFDWERLRIELVPTRPSNSITVQECAKQFKCTENAANHRLLRAVFAGTMTKTKIGNKVYFMFTESK